VLIEGLELFEYLDLYSTTESIYSSLRAGPMKLQRLKPSGLFHIAITMPDPKATHDRIVSAGGQKSEATFTSVQNQPYTIAVPGVILLR